MSLFCMMICFSLNKSHCVNDYTCDKALYWVRQGPTPYSLLQVHFCYFSFLIILCSNQFVKLQEKKKQHPFFIGNGSNWYYDWGALTFLWYYIFLSMSLLCLRLLIIFQCFPHAYLLVDFPLVVGIITIFLFLINVLGWHWLVITRKVQVYIFGIWCLQTCVCSLTESSLLPSPYICPPHFGDHRSVVCSYGLVFIHCFCFLRFYIPHRSKITQSLSFSDLFT